MHTRDQKFLLFLNIHRIHFSAWLPGGFLHQLLSSWGFAVSVVSETGLAWHPEFGTAISFPTKYFVVDMSKADFSIALRYEIYDCSRLPGIAEGSSNWVIRCTCDIDNRNAFDSWMDDMISMGAVTL